MDRRRIAPDPPLATIADAFSLTAETYDRFAEDHPHLTRMRERVHAHVAALLAPGASVLELNCGTGTDAVALAQRGFRVHATDIAPGMLARIDEKVERLGLGDRVTSQRCSFLELGAVDGAPYDAVFSDLGGLNCVADLRPVIEQLPQVLRPGGVVTWVLMPRICLWELGLVALGRPRLATRRLARNGTQAHLEGRHFPVYYFRPRRVVRDFGPQFRPLRLEGLAVITPTAESKGLAVRHPRLYSALSFMDDRLAPHRPWSGFGDFFILSLRYRP